MGRLRELWKIHTALNPVTIADHENANTLVQIVGLGGIGKSLLSAEYASRFGAAYPDGIYWLRSRGPDSHHGEADHDFRRQLEDVAISYGIDISAGDFGSLRTRLATRLGAGRSYLWIVDD